MQFDQTFRWRPVDKERVMTAVQKLPSPKRLLRRVSKNGLLFIGAALGVGAEGQAEQEAPFARPAHGEVIPVLREPLPAGAFEFFPTNTPAGLFVGLSTEAPGLAMPEAIDAFVAAPARGAPVTTRDDVVLALMVDKPLGCYRTTTDVVTVDETRHLVTVELVAADEEPCVASRREERVEVPLGRLVAGEHAVVIGDGARTQAQLTVLVRPAAPPLGE